MNTVLPLPVWQCLVGTEFHRLQNQVLAKALRELASSKYEAVIGDLILLVPEGERFNRWGECVAISGARYMTRPNDKALLISSNGFVFFAGELNERANPQCLYNAPGAGPRSLVGAKAINLVRDRGLPLPAVCRVQSS